MQWRKPEVRPKQTGWYYVRQFNPERVRTEISLRHWDATQGVWRMPSLMTMTINGSFDGWLNVPEVSEHVHVH
jgi:hypothetical protein